jgi:hypothetical protein
MRNEFAKLEGETPASCNDGVTHTRFTIPPQTLENQTKYIENFEKLHNRQKRTVINGKSFQVMV